MIGTWKMNIAKSHFSPGPAIKSGTVTLSEDGEWIVSKAEVVNDSGQAITRNNRYKADGNTYPYDGPYGKGTISVKNNDARHSTATFKFEGGNVVTQRVVISADGKTRTTTSTGTNASGQKVDTTVVFDRQ